MATMEIVGQTVVSLQAALLSLWSSFLGVFPGIVAALVIVVIGGFIGLLFGKILTRVLVEAKIDKWLAGHGLREALAGLQVSKVFGSILKWYIIVVFLGEAASLIRLEAIRTFVLALVGYVPLLIGAFIILLLGLLIGEYAKMSIMNKMQFKQKSGVAKFTKFLVVYFAVVIGLQTANFKVDILVDAFRIGFTALVGVLAVILGVTFAFAVRNDIKQWWKDILK